MNQGFLGSISSNTKRERENEYAAFHSYLAIGSGITQK